MPAADVKPLLVLAAVYCVCGSAAAVESRTIEEVIVTAQRVEEPASKVPIAMSVFDRATLRDRQIVGLSELYVNVPNVTFLPRQGGTVSNLHIRGLGWQAVGEEALGAIHINEVPFPNLRAQTELYDMERVEVLRGPQGTLYGRNATAGALNLITRKPDPEEIGGYLQLELGDYDHRRIEGAVNLPVTDRLALRIAGTALERDGYLDNAAGDRVPGVDEDVDDRDQYALRVTGAWQFSDTTDLWVMYDRFDEDSHRLWDGDTVCKQSELPVNAGCAPNQFGRDLAHPGANFLGVAMGFDDGLIQLGARDAASGLDYEYPRPVLDAREVYRDGRFKFRLEEDIWNFGLEHRSDQWSWDLTGGYQRTDLRSEQPNTSRAYPVGFTLGTTDENPSGLWPTSAFPASYDSLRTTPGCEWNAYRAGVLGGCIADVPQTRGVAYHVGDSELEYGFVESKFRADVNDTLSFLIGANYSDQRYEGFQAFPSNTNDMISLEHIGNLPGPLYPGISAFQGKIKNDNYGIFSELYWQLTGDVKLTIGARYNKDEKRFKSAIPRPESLDINANRLLGPTPIWVRGTLLSYLSPGAPSPQAEALADYYGATDAIAAASGPAELIAALQLVPPTEELGETRALGGRPDKLTDKEWSGRVVVDWVINPGALVYAKFDRGFLPGSPGFANSPDVDSETIDSYEIGSKLRLLDDTLSLNVAAFVYRYHDMRVGPGTGTQLAGLNVDVDGHGAEIDATWQPSRIPNLTLELAYGWVNVELDDYAEIDDRDLTQGNADYVALNAFDAFGTGFVARVADVLPLVDQAIADGAAIGAAAAPGTLYPNGIPSYFSRGYLEANGVPTLNGIPAQMKGNQTRHAPEHNVTIGLAYSWFLSPGTLTARWDYYWQDESYGSVFNSPYDKIDSWDQHNASLMFESADGRWDTQLWVRNLQDDDNVYGRANRQQIVYGEPRIYGVSFRYNWIR